MPALPPVVITTAVTAEAAPIVRRLGLVRNRTVLDDAIVYTGTHNRQPIVMMVTGIGAARAGRLARQVIERCRPAAVIVSGFAGGANPNLRVGDLVQPVIVEDEQTGRRFQPSIFADGIGQLRTAAQLVSTPAEKALHFNNGADAVDMETAAIAHACEERGVRWLCVRAVSDAADQGLPPYLAKLTKLDGRPDMFAAVLLAVTRPGATGPLLNLARACRSAGDSMARRIIELLPRCAG